MEVDVQLFGPYRAAASQAVVRVDLGEGDANAATAQAVLRCLARQVPALRELLPTARLAVNHGYVAADHRVQAGDELAVIGLVGGG